jgi:hypothetical protein
MRDEDAKRVADEAARKMLKEFPYSEMSPMTQTFVVRAVRRGVDAGLAAARRDALGLR